MLNYSSWTYESVNYAVRQFRRKYLYYFESSALSGKTLIPPYKEFEKDYYHIFEAYGRYIGFNKRACKRMFKAKLDYLLTGLQAPTESLQDTVKAMCEPLLKEDKEPQFWILSKFYYDKFIQERYSMSVVEKVIRSLVEAEKESKVKS